MMKSKINYPLLAIVLFLCLIFSFFRPRPEVQPTIVTVVVSQVVTQVVEKIVTATPLPFTATPLFTPTITNTPGPTDTPAPTVDQSAVSTARAEAMQKQAKSDGFYLIGVDIAPGVWRSNGSGGSCYWSVTTATGDIINNHFGQAGGTVFLPADGFQVQFLDCGVWEFLQ